jgi:hypothetical protein
MPGFDGTGPLGQGPMTGGGRGFCAMPNRAYGPSGYGVRAPYHYPSFGPSPVYGYGGYGPVFGAGRGGLPWGGGRGRVFGGGRGFRRWW